MQGDVNSSTAAVVITQVEAIRAAIMSVITSGVSMAVLLHLVYLSAEQLAGITAFASNALILAFLFYKPKSSIVSPQTIAVNPTQAQFVTPPPEHKP